MIDGKLYLKTENYGGHDTYYFRLGEDKTFAEILHHIEMVLDSGYTNNEDKLEGIKINCEIVSLTPEEYDNIDWDDE